MENRRAKYTKRSCICTCEMRPEISVSKMVQLFKGSSSRVIREEFPELKEFLWGKSFWADGYFAETSGQVSEDKIREYINNQ